MLLDIFLKYSRGGEVPADDLASFADRLNLGQLQEAREIAYHLCEVPACRNSGIFAVGLVAFVDGDLKSAKNSWNILGESGCHTPLIIFANALVDMEMGKTDMLPRMISLCRENYPDFYEIDFLEALFFVRAGLNEQAKEALEGILSSRVLTDVEAKQLGIAYATAIAALGYYSDAISICKEVRDQAGRGGEECIRILFECFAATDNRNEAVELFESMRVSDVSLKTAAGVCKALATLGLNNAALEVMASWLRVDPVNIELLSLQAVVLVRVGDKLAAAQAKDKLERVVFSKKKGIPFFISDNFVRCYMPYHALTLVNWDACHTLYNAILHVIRNGVEGDIVECGVFRGGVSAFMAKVLVDQDSVHRKLYLCDTYEGMTVPDENDLLGSDSSKTSSAVNLYFPGLAKIDKRTVERVVLDAGYPAENIVIVKGAVEETLPQQAPDKISILRLDTDWYKSTLHELDALVSRVSRYGIVIIDDYASWDGARKAFHEYAERQSLFYFPTIDIIQGSLTFMKCD